MEFKKNDCVTVTIEDMGSDGEGIGKVDGFTLFIKDAVIGDQVEAKIIKSKKHYAYARLEKVLQPSPFRVEPKCAYHRQCGGCLKFMLSSVTLFNLSARLALAISTVLSYAIFEIGRASCRERV